jgi:hypothetical protein
MVRDPESANNAAISEDVIRKFIQEGERAIADRSYWEKKLEVWYARRYGLRSPKTFPWPGCSNLNIPLTDKVIRRLQPVFQSAVFRVSPIVSIEPLGQTSTETARSLEHGYDWLVRYRMKNARQAMQYVDDALLMYGFAVSKITWEYEADRFVRKEDVSDIVPVGTDRSEIPEQDIALELSRRFSLDPSKEDERDLLEEATRQFFAGEEVIEVETDRVIYNAPRWQYVDPIDAIVPWDSDLDIDNFPWFIHRTYLADHELEHRAKSKRYDPQKVKSVLDSEKAKSASLNGSTLEQRRQWREGVSGGKAMKKENSHEIWEVYFRHDLNNDGVSERYVATVHYATSEILRVIPYPYEHNEWPFTRFAFEMTEPRWYSSRGIPELIYDLQVEVNAQHNAKLDNMAITNSKSFIYRDGSVRNPEKWRFRPGAMFPARRPEDVVPLNHQILDFSFNAEEEALRAWAEEYVGTPDFGISNINQRVERRTATEIQQIQSSTGAVAESALETFQESMRRQHRQTLFLWAQYGEPQVLVRVNGGLNEIVFVRFDLYKDFDLIPTGKLDNLTPNDRINRAFSVMQLVNNPTTARYINAFEVTKDIIENVNYRDSQRYLLAPGVFEQNENLEQINEINVMDAIGEVHPVDVSDDHELHLQILGQAIEAAADDPGKQMLLQGHAVMHLYLMGERSALEQFQQQTGAQVEQVGNRLVMGLPQQQMQQEQSVPPGAEGV